MYKLVERECEKIEAEVREQVDREMRAKKDSKRRAKAVTPFDDVRGWDRRIRTIKREIKHEFDVDLDRKEVKKEPVKPARSTAGRVTQVMPSARKAFMESLKRKGVIAEKVESAEKTVGRRTSIKATILHQSPPQALTVKEELLPIVHDRLLRENSRRNNQSNVALVHASHGCRTTAFRSRLTAHTLLGVDIKPTTTTTVATATVIATAHKDTSVEEEDHGSEGPDAASNVEVISVVSTPSLFLEEQASPLAVEDGPNCGQGEPEQPAADTLSTCAPHVEDDDDEESDLIFHLVKMEVEAENQDAPPPRGDNEHSQEYSENFEDEIEPEDNDDAATMRSDRLSTIPEDAEASRASATEFSLDRRVSSQGAVGMKGDGGAGKSQSESLVLESAPDSRELAATSFAFAQDSTAAGNLLEFAPELDSAPRARESSPTQQSIEERPATPPIPASSERSRSNAVLESSLELSKCDDRMDVAEDQEKKEESKSEKSGVKEDNRATDPMNPATVDAVGQTSFDHDSSFERLKADRALEANTSSFSTSSLETASKVSLSEISSGQLLLLADAAIASEEGEVGPAACTATGYFADLSASSAAEESAPPRLSRLRRKSFEADPARLSSTSSESRSEGEVVPRNPDSKSPA